MGTGLIDSGPQTPQPKQVKTVKEEPSVTDKLFATPKAEPYEPAELDPLQPYPEVVTDDNGALLLRFSDRKTKWYEKSNISATIKHNRRTCQYAKCQHVK